MHDDLDGTLFDSQLFDALDCDPFALRRQNRKRAAASVTDDVRWTDHAALRLAQRGISGCAVEAALDWGRPQRQRGGRVVYHLGNRAVRRALRCGVDLRQFQGVAVVLSGDGFVVTVYKGTPRRRFRK